MEHDPLLYEDAEEMVEHIAQALKQTSREATILLYAPALDPHRQKIAKLDDREGFISIEGKREKSIACTPLRLDFRQTLQGTITSM